MTGRRRPRTLRRPTLAGAAGGLLAVLLAFAALWGDLAAQTPEQQADAAFGEQLYTTWDSAMDAAEGAFDETELGEDLIPDTALGAFRTELEGVRADALQRADALTADADPLRQQIAALGEPAEGEVEPPAVAQERANLTARLATIEGEAKKAQLAATRASALLTRLADITRERFLGRLMLRGATPLNPEYWGQALVDYASLGVTAFGEVTDALSSPLRRRVILNQAPLAGMGLLAMFFLLIWARRQAVDYLSSRLREGDSRGQRLALGIGLTAARMILPIAATVLIIGGLFSFGLMGQTGLILMEEVGFLMVLAIAANALAYAYYAPTQPSLRLSNLPDRPAATAARMVLLLAIVIGLDGVLLEAGERAGLPIPTLTVANFLVLVLIALVVVPLTSVLRIKIAPPDAEEPEDGEEATHEPSVAQRLIRAGSRLLLAAAILGPILAALGYFAAARFVVLPVIATGAIIGVCVLIYAFVREVIEAYIEARPTVAGVDRWRLIPIFAGLALILAAMPLVAINWGASTEDLGSAWRALGQGLTVGEVTISPVDFIVFVLVFIFGYTLVRLAQSVLRSSVLPRTGFDEGVKTAVNAGVGYVGFFLVAMAAISATGLDLSNLAIVAGALSVGIGFGLQNIVNNFVSGIILLVERPIKVGDWIELGGVHGTVRRIKVRATEVETFDRATLIVPNSNLIADSVTNWTHTNNVGRLIIPVGVAYGTDVRQVERVLKEIAAEQPMFLKYPAPSVYFMGFGSDSLDFELRGFLRDVNWILSIRSEVNFEVARRFEEEGIEIPFAQRDLNIRNAREVADAFGDAFRAEPPTIPKDQA